MNPRRRRMARQRRKNRREPWRYVRVTLEGVRFELVPFRATWRTGTSTATAKGHYVVALDREGIEKALETHPGDPTLLELERMSR